MYKFKKIALSIAFVLGVTAGASAQTKSFTPVEGPGLKAKIDNAITQGRAQGRFWVGYQFEVRPGVAIDFEIVGPSGTFSVTGDGWSVSDNSGYETRELGFFMFFENERDRFTRAEVYNLKREHQFSGYPVYWAGKATNEESLNYLKSIVDSPATDMNRLMDRAAFAIALHDDARVESILTDLVKKPAPESIRNRAIYWLGYTPESQAKNNFLADLVRNQRESSDARLQAMSALGMSKAATTLPLLETMYETMTSRDLKRRALNGIARNDNRDGAATYLIRIAENENDFELRKSAIANLGRVAGEKSLGVLTSTIDSSPEIELQKQAVIALGRRPKDEAIPILIRTARSHPKMEIRKLAVQTLGHTGDERAISLFKELLEK
ncbi:MAG TPA: HEAT repeat domain-containing protein [Pyrinomonadaceae bacterium]|nr:HEAT repeat domain-containing protein [Pyrinomonadaceae bacterium]